MLFKVLFCVFLFSIIEARPAPDEAQPEMHAHKLKGQYVTRMHKIKGQYVTRIHKFRENVGGNDGTENGGTDTQVNNNKGSDLDGSYLSKTTVNRIGINGAAVNGGTVTHVNNNKGSDLDGSHLSKTNVNRRQNCNRGLVDKTATGLYKGIKGLTGKLFRVVNVLTDGGTFLGPVGDAVNRVAEGALNLVDNAVGGVNFAVNDAACGLGNMAYEAAEGLNTGDILGGVGNMGKELVGGIGNMAEDLASNAAEGVGKAADNIFGILSDLGK